MSETDTAAFLSRPSGHGDCRATGAAAAELEAATLAWMREVAPYGILTTDRELRIQTWNEWLSLHSGFDSSAVVGRSLLEVFPEIKQRGLDEHYQRALDGEISVLATALHRYLVALPPSIRDGAYSHMQQTARIAPLLTSGSVRGTITIVEDVTQREAQAALMRREHEQDRLLSWVLGHLLQSRDPLRDVGEIFPKVAAALELELYCSYMFEPASATLRLHTSGGSAAKPDCLPQTLAFDEGYCGRCARERTPVIVAHVQDGDDPPGAIPRRLGMRSVAAFPLIVGERLLGTLSFATSAREVIAHGDVALLTRVAQFVAVAIERGLRESVLHETQAALSRHAETLEAKIAERTATLHETIGQLESFSFTVAHDLRTPIRSLTGYCDILLTDFGEQIPEAGRFMLQKLSHASTRLDALTRDLLRFSKVSRENLELTVLNLDELVSEIVLITPALQGGVLRIEGNLGSVKAQRTLLQQCLSNLFDNALKFVAPGRKPEIVVRAERCHGLAPLDAGSAGAADPTTAYQSGPVAAPVASQTSAAVAPSALRVRIDVIDNGIGIPSEAHRRIFGIFERGSGLHGIEGTGIGLAIVERASQRMGGRCGVDSEVDHGSRFWIELAAGDAGRPSPAPDS